MPLAPGYSGEPPGRHPILTPVRLELRFTQEGLGPSTQSGPTDAPWVSGAVGTTSCLTALLTTLSCLFARWSYGRS